MSAPLSLQRYDWGHIQRQLDAEGWALLPALFLTVVLIIRTRLEDQTLQAELSGYREYAQRVRYRLVPGVW